MRHHIKLINKCLLEYRKFGWHVIDHITIGKQHNGAVGREEDEDVPDPMKIRKANSGPVGTEEPVIDPSCESHANDPDTPLSQPDNSLVLLLS